MTTTFPHFGILVEDLDRSVRFYVEGLGFEVAGPQGRAEGIGALVGLPGAVAETQFIAHPGGGRIELHRFLGYPATGPRARPANQSGLSHLCFVVDDLDAVAAKLVALGGEALQDTRLDADYGRLIFCRDPDGVRIELVQMTAAWPAQTEPAAS